MGRIDLWAKGNTLCWMYASHETSVKGHPCNSVHSACKRAGDHVWNFENLEGINDRNVT